MRHIWMYWENPPGHNKPAYLELCLRSIDRWKNGLDLRLVDDRSVLEYITDLREDLSHLSLNHKSDYYRSRLVHRYGGIWLDADVIALRPLTELLEGLGDHDGAFYGRGPSNLSANCFAARPGSPLLAEWMSLQDQTLDDHEDIPWNGLGKDPLVIAAAHHVFTLIAAERIAPIPWQKWKTLLSRWRSPRRYLQADPIVFMLYNKYLHDAFGSKSASDILKGHYLISKLFRIALSQDSDTSHLPR